MSAASLLQDIALSRTDDLTEPIGLYLQYAKELERSSSHAMKARAQFIRDQCSGFSGKSVFEKYAGKWGIPKFADGLVNVEDFKRGFLFTFRDRDKTFRDCNIARQWFMDSPEAYFARRYEFWKQDAGKKNCKAFYSGTYREILQFMNYPG